MAAAAAAAAAALCGAGGAAKPGPHSGHLRRRPGIFRILFPFVNTIQSTLGNIYCKLVFFFTFGFFSCLRPHLSTASCKREIYSIM